MDFLDPAKRRAHTIRLTIGYVLIALAIAVVSLILLLQSYGYDIDRHTGNIIRNGLVFVSARPDSANITLNGEDKGKTNARLTLPAGSYTLELTRSGYRTWKRTFSLDGGSLERLTYPLLFPEKLEPKDVELYSSLPTLATISPDRHWIIVQKPQTFDSFDVFDANQTNPLPTVIALPSSLLTKASGAENNEIIEWSTDNRHLLIKHTFSGGSEFIIIDRQEPRLSVNVNKELSTSPAQVSFYDKKPDQLYLFDPVAANLKRQNLKTKQITLTLTDVLAFKSYGAEAILYVSAEQVVAGKVQLKLIDNEKTHNLRGLPANTNYLLDISRYDNNWYVAAVAQSEKIITIYKNPQNAPKPPVGQVVTPVSVLKLDSPSSLSFSASSEFIAAQSGQKFAVYDVEKNRRYYYSLAAAANSRANWMDESRMVMTNDAQVVVFDYDGANAQSLIASSGSFQTMFDRDYTALYSIAPSAVVSNRTALTRTSLKATQ